MNMVNNAILFTDLPSGMNTYFEKNVIPGPGYLLV